MPTAKDVLNELKWHRGQLGEAAVFYVHRGAPGDVAAVLGKDIVELRHSFFDLRDGASIPYHRVLRVEARGEVVWERRARAGGGSASEPGKR